MARRNSRGRFVKTHSSPRRRRSTRSVALVRTSPAPVVIRERSVAVTHRRRGGRRRHHGGGGGLIGPGLKGKGIIAAWASALGYLETQRSDTFEKVPTFGKLPREAVIGLVAHFVGKKNKHIQHLSTAALTIAGYKIGANGFSLSGFEE